MKRRQFITGTAAIGGLAILKPGTLFGAAADEKAWHIEQFQDKSLSHYSYAISVGKQIFLIDPERDPKKYTDYAKRINAKITSVIETHPHADFASSHLELQRSQGAKIYASSLSKATYPFIPLYDGQLINLNKSIKLRAIDTPGHAPDHVAIALHVNNKDIAVFSGDALLIGDVGRPDLRDYSNDIDAQRQRLAEKMYTTIHQKFNALADDVIVYPAHGAGSLCGKAIKDAPSSTIGEQKAENPAFQIKDKTAFVAALLNDLPFVPKYFPFDVGSNLKGFANLEQSIAKVPLLPETFKPATNEVLIDARPENLFKASYIDGAVNLQREGRFETWLGSIISPDTHFYVTAENTEALNDLIYRTSKIGYEGNLKGAFVYSGQADEKWTTFNTAQFNPAGNEYTIIDVRTDKEYKEQPLFKNAINIPLQDLEKELAKVPADKPVLVTCASGYRSAAGSSLIKKHLPQLNVYDLGKAVKQYKNIEH